MSTLLTRVILETDDIHRRKSKVAKPKKHIRGKVIQDVNEKVKVALLVNECRFHDVVILSNFEAKLGLYAPISGYCAVMYGDTTFRLDMISRQLFRRLTIVELKRTARFSDVEIQQGLKRLNQFIRDVSPLPPSPHRKRWIASLGSFAWVGVYERRVVADEVLSLLSSQQKKKNESTAPAEEDNVVQKTTGELQHIYVLVYVSSLDEGSYRELYTHLDQHAHGKLPVSKVCQEILNPYREIEREKCGRVMAVAAAVLEEPTVQSFAAPDTSSYDDDNNDEEEKEHSFLPEQLWSWLPETVPIPCDYVLPNRKPRDCPEFPSSDMASFTLGRSQFIPSERRLLRPRRLQAMFECELDSLGEYSQALMGHFVRYSNCTDISKTNGKVPFIRGPLDPILIRQVSNPSVAFAKQYHAVVCQAPQGPPRLSQLQSTISHTWEDESLIRNRLVDATFEMDPPSLLDEADDEKWISMEIFYPTYIRVSCRCSRNVVIESENSERKRMSGFCGDNWSGL